eukprot:2464186-Prymnesium_polylepis.1
MAMLWALPHRPSRAPPTRGTRSSGNLRQRSEADHWCRPEAARALSSTRSHLGNARSSRRRQG